MKNFSGNIVVMNPGPFRLGVPSRRGEVLSVTINGRLFYDTPNGGSDDLWILAPPNTGFYSEGFYLVSANYRLAIDYKPERGEGLCTSPLTFQSTHTIWYVTPDSEIFTIDHDGEKRYLWSILDSVYVTPDEHLAERWTAVSLEGYGVPLTPPKENPNAIPVLGIILVVLLVIYLYR